MKSLTPVFAATSLVAGIAAAYLLLQLRDERTRSHELQERVTALELAQARPSATVTPAAISQPATAPDATVAVSQPTSTGLGTDPTSAAPSPAAPVRISSNDLIKDPDFRASMEMSLRQSIGQSYPDLARELELSPEQARKLLDLIASSTIAGMTMITDEKGATRVNSGNREQTQARRDDEIRALLGDTKLQQWKSYEQSLPARQQVVRLRTTLESTGGSLNQRQEQQLIASIAEEQKRQTAEAARVAQIGAAARSGQATLENVIQLTEEGNRRILDASLSYLSPQQQDALRAQQNMELAAMRAMLRMQRPQNAGSGTAP